MDSIRKIILGLVSKGPALTIGEIDDVVRFIEAYVADLRDSMNQDQITIKRLRSSVEDLKHLISMKVPDMVGSSVIQHLYKGEHIPAIKEIRRHQAIKDLHNAKRVYDAARDLMRETK